MEKEKAVNKVKEKGYETLGSVGEALLSPMVLLIIAAAVIYFIYEAGAKGIYIPKQKAMGQVHST